MTVHVYSFRDGVGRLTCVRLYRMAPNAYGGGGSSPLNHYTLFVNGAVAALVTARPSCPTAHRQRSAFGARIYVLRWEPTVKP